MGESCSVARDCQDAFKIRLAEMSRLFMKHDFSTKRESLDGRGERERELQEPSMASECISGDTVAATCATWVVFKLTSARASSSRDGDCELAAVTASRLSFGCLMLRDEQEIPRLRS